MEHRANLALFLVAVFCIWCLISFATSVLFYDVSEIRVSVIDTHTREVRFPTVMGVSRSPVIIIPATSEPVGGDRFLIKEAVFVTHFQDRHYWVSEDLIITDFVRPGELRDVPVVSGVSFILERGEFKVVSDIQKELLVHVKRLLSDGKIWSIVSHVDLVNGCILLKRGIQITVFDWEKLSKSTEALYDLSLTALDKTEFLFLGEGRLLRVR